MTDAPAPTARTNEPAQASFLPPLAITGASGNVGGVVARLLSERGLPLRLLANTPSRAPKLPGARAIQCSYEDTPASREALTGVDVLFMVSAPESEDRLDKHIAFVDAAAASGVCHIVYLSFINPAPDATFTLARTHFHTEEHIKASGMTYTFLRDNFYADFFVALPDEEGRILGPAGDGRVGVVAREDAGRVAAEVLAAPGSFENQTLDVTGPEALTLDEIAAILTRVQGRPVTYVRETVEEAYESRKKWPAAQWQYDSWVSTYTSIARREMDVVSTTVRDVTGRDPFTFEEVARAALVVGPLTAAVVACPGLASLLSELRGEYIKRGLDPKNLSRTIEDAATVWEPILPWTSAGAYMAGTLGVATLAYLPWAISNWIVIFFALVWAATGIGIAKLTPEEQKALEAEG